LIDATMVQYITAESDVVSVSVSVIVLARFVLTTSLNLPYNECFFIEINY